VALLAEQVPWALANALITVVSTLLCTELHSRFTFGSGRSAGWREHWQSAGSAAAAYVVTCAAMFVLHLVQSSPGMLTEQFVYLGASGLAGLARFLLLRLYVFATGRDRTSVPERTAGGTVFSPVPVRTGSPRPTRTQHRPARAAANRPRRTELRPLPMKLEAPALAGAR
jgi:putative flippase GtrA